MEALYVTKCVSLVLCVGMDNLYFFFLHSFFLSLSLSLSLSPTSTSTFTLSSTISNGEQIDSLSPMSLSDSSGETPMLHRKGIDKPSSKFRHNLEQITRHLVSTGQWKHGTSAKQYESSRIPENEIETHSTQDNEKYQDDFWHEFSSFMDIDSRSGSMTSSISEVRLVSSAKEGDLPQGFEFLQTFPGSSLVAGGSGNMVNVNKGVSGRRLHIIFKRVQRSETEHTTKLGSTKELLNNIPFSKCSSDQLKALRSVKAPEKFMSGLITSFSLVSTAPTPEEPPHGFHLLVQPKDSSTPLAMHSLSHLSTISVSTNDGTHGDALFLCTHRGMGVPITDIGVVSAVDCGQLETGASTKKSKTKRREQASHVWEPPIGFHVLRRTPFGNDANLNGGNDAEPLYLAFRPNIWLVLNQLLNLERELVCPQYFLSFSSSSSSSSSFDQIHSLRNIQLAAAHKAALGGAVKLLALIVAALYSPEQSLVLDSIGVLHLLPPQALPALLLNISMDHFRSAANIFVAHFSSASYTQLFRHVSRLFKTRWYDLSVKSVLSLWDLCMLFRHEQAQLECWKNMIDLLLVFTDKSNPCLCQLHQESGYWMDSRFVQSVRLNKGKSSRCVLCVRDSSKPSREHKSETSGAIHMSRGGGEAMACPQGQGNVPAYDENLLDIIDTSVLQFRLYEKADDNFRIEFLPALIEQLFPYQVFDSTLQVQDKPTSPNAHRQRCERHCEKLLMAALLLLLKFASENSTSTSSHSECFKRKEHALTLLLHLLQYGGALFRSSASAVLLLRRFLCPVLIECSTAHTSSIFRMVLQIILTTWQLYRDVLVVEFGVLWDELLLALLENPLCPLEHKQHILDMIGFILESPDAAVELFLNFDNGNGIRNPRVFERLFQILSKIVTESAIPSRSTGIQEKDKGIGGSSAGVTSGISQNSLYAMNFNFEDKDAKDTPKTSSGAEEPMLIEEFEEGDTSQGHRKSEYEYEESGRQQSIGKTKTEEPSKSTALMKDTITEPTNEVIKIAQHRNKIALEIQQAALRLLVHLLQGMSQWTGALSSCSTASSRSTKRVETITSATPIPPPPNFSSAAAIAATFQFFQNYPCGLRSQFLRSSKDNHSSSSEVLMKSPVQSLTSVQIDSMEIMQRFEQRQEERKELDTLLKEASGKKRLKAALIKLISQASKSQVKHTSIITREEIVSDFLFRFSAGHSTGSALYSGLTSSLDRSEVGDILSNLEDDLFNEIEYKNLRFQFIRNLDFVGMSFDAALRFFLTEGGFRLPGEAQKIDRLLETFCVRYCQDNPGKFSSASTAFVVAFALIMLNTDLHDPRLKRGRKRGKREPMTLQQFITNLRGVDDGTDLDSEFLESMYHNIRENEVRMEVTGREKSFRLKAEAPLQRAPNMTYDAKFRQQHELERTGTALILRRCQAVLKSVHRRIMLQSQSKELGITNNTKAILGDQSWKTTLCETAVRIMFKLIWFRAVAALSTLVEQTQELEVLYLCLDGLTFGTILCIILGMATERQAFARPLAKLTFIENHR